MKLLLMKDVDHLGFVGDVVDVKNGYARNYLLPQRLAIEPTKANIKAIEAAKAQAAEERRLRMEQMKQAADRLAGVEVTIAAAANRDGTLYGSVGPREIAAALRAEGHSIDPNHIILHDPIRHLDNIMVPIRFAADLTVEVKVWVIRETAAGDLDEEESAEPTGMEAATSGDHTATVSES
ncbi:MAG: 50S ribosomal protein L9 [Phycisphaerae bacterium]|nr:50S ribosomal protein L9 [Phycisphaerae bacterium]